MQEPDKSGKSWRIVLWSSVVVLLAAAGFAAWQLRGASDHPVGHVPLRPIGVEALHKDLQALIGWDPAGLTQLLAPTPEIREFAERATAGKRGVAARTQALLAALGQRREQRAFVDWPRVEPRVAAPLTAAATWHALEHAGAERQLYPLELAALGVAALRSVDVPAMLAEVSAWAHEPRPLDPSGRFGYFGVFVPDPDAGADASAQPRGRVYDAYGGRSSAPAQRDVVVLNDAQAIGAALGLRAMYALSSELDLAAADRDSAAALALVPNSASAHAVRAALLLTIGQPAARDGKAGRQELETALKLRDGPAQHVNLALQALTRQDVLGALKDLGDVLSEQPDYALAHVVRGAALLMQHNLEGARAELDRAGELDPQLGFVPQMRAQLLAAEGKSDEALVEARRAVTLSPQDAGSLFILARIEQRLEMTDEVRKHAAMILARTPVQARRERKAQLRTAFGDGVLESPSHGAAGAGNMGAAGGHASL